MRADQGQAKAASGLGTRAPDRGLPAFGETANPAEYVPREACERALRGLERAVREGQTAALTASPGLGKTLLLRILEDRLRPGFRCVFLPYAALTERELCAWVLGLLDADPTADDPGEALVARARELAEAGDRLTLLIDDAGSMPIDTARGLAARIQRSGNQLRVVAAASDDAASSRVLAALHPDVAELRLAGPMTGAETAVYIETRLEQARVDEARSARFDSRAVAWIHRLSQGVPRRVHELGTSLLDAPPEGVGTAWAEERWLGAPLGDLEGDDGELDPELPGGLPADDEEPELLLDEDDVPFS